MGAGAGVWGGGGWGGGEVVSYYLLSLYDSFQFNSVVAISCSTILVSFLGFKCSRFDLTELINEFYNCWQHRKKKCNDYFQSMMLSEVTSVLLRQI